MLAQGLCVILENRLTHPLLKELLPLLANHIHDTSEKVRIALLDLLILVKGMKAIKVSGWAKVEWVGWVALGVSKEYVRDLSCTLGAVLSNLCVLPVLGGGTRGGPVGADGAGQRPGGQADHFSVA